MALFKPLKGTRTSLNSQPLHDGYAYFCTDDGSFHIDYTDADGNLQRKQLNAKDAETLCGKSLTELQNEININTEEIAKKANSADVYLKTETYTRTQIDTKLSNKSDSTHNHDSAYDVKGAASDALDSAKTYTDTTKSELTATINNKADKTHTHDDRYYTETEIDTKLSGKSDTTHNHNSAYDTKGAASSALNSAKAYTDTAKAELTETIDTKADNSVLASHTSNQSNPHGVTLSQLGVTATTTELNYVDGVTSNIQTQLNAKASATDLKAHTDNKSNPHGVTAAQVGADTKGSAAAVQANLDVVDDKVDEHIGDSNIHVTTTNKSNWNTAYTHSQAAHARTDATKVADSTTNGNILINGTETNVYTHPSSGVTTGTYKSVTVNAQGHITAGTNPTTLAGYGITDAETKGAANTALASAKTYTDTVASGKADKTHNHDSDYDAKGAADSALASAKTYADTAATNVKNDLLNGAGGAYDTLKELGDLIDDNTDAIDALETVAAGKADKTHSHAISDVTDLQTTLDGKAAKSHGTHVSWSTTTPKANGTATVGSETKVARGDHVHPTDTTRASQVDFDTHVANTTAHITSAERSNWNAAKTHADSAHAPSNAQPNQNAFSNIKVGSTTVAADTATDTVEFVGSNVTITPDATNDKVTFAVADGSTSTKGIVQLTNSTSSTSTTTAATPSSVKSAYDLANTAKTNAATAQTRADAAYTLAEGKVDSLSDLGITATAAELNYVDGATSNIQAQIDSKVKKSGDTMSGALQISRTAADKASPTAQDLAINYSLPSGGTLTEKNAPGIGFHIGNVGWANFIYDGTFKFANNSFTGYAPVKASKFIGALEGNADTASSATKLATARTIRTNLGSTSTASFDGSGNVTPGVTGTLPIANGGTGATTATAALTNLGITATAAELNKMDGVTATTTELNYVDGVTGNIQTQLDTKQATITGAATTITSSNLTANRALVSNGSGKVAVSAVTSTELGYLDGVTSAIQAQLDSKLNVAGALEALGIYIGPNKPTNSNIKIWINTAEEGTSIIPVLPRIATITLSASEWVGSAEPYSQVVSIPNVGITSKVDLQPTAAQIVALQNAETTLMASNNGGTVTIHAIGNKPTSDYTMQVLIQEVSFV